MKKHELLVPVQDMECLKQAIANGADAVYGGCQNFGARKFAKNFTDEEMIEAIRLCHLYDVKFYVTMNTLVKDAEVSDFLKQVEFLYKNGVDAIIMQDFGMISYVLKKYPNLEVHASTQFNNSSYDVVKLLYDMGVKRVVMSRELTLQEIEEIDVPIEKEVFIHGALCISYSGCCLMSSMIGGRSGNRGECAGSCRLPYKLYYKDRLLSDSKYLLSTRELNTSSRFLELLNSNIYSFKIEGRMKSPEYVGFITKLYRRLIDNSGNISDLDLETEKLKTIFHREFTCGHLFQTDVFHFMNPDTPNHIGLPIGKVVSWNSSKIGIRLDKPLHQGDGIRFLESGKGLIVNYLYDQNGLLISKADSGEVCYVDNKIGLNDNNTVSKTLDYLLMHELKVIPSKKIPISFSVKARVGAPFTVQISDGFRKIQLSGNVIERAITIPVSKSKICSQLEKLGGTPFVSTSIDVEMDADIFISLREINELRRELVERLMNARMMPKYEAIIQDFTFDGLSLSRDLKNSASVFTKEQLETCLELGFERIYTSNLSLFRQYEDFDKVYYSMPRCLFYVKNQLEGNSLVKEFCDFSSIKNVIGDYSFNVCNIYTAYFLYRMGLSKLTLSVELSNAEVLEFVHCFERTFSCLPNIEVVGYGRVEVMIIKDNILNLKEEDYQYSLVDLRKRSFPVYFSDGKTIILNYQNTISIDFPSLNKISSIRYQFFTESREEILNIVKKV